MGQGAQHGTLLVGSAATPRAAQRVESLAGLHACSACQQIAEPACAKIDAEAQLENATSKEKRQRQAKD
jgi:hypothetical protein